jgi:hypothetical protein
VTAVTTVIAWIRRWYGANPLHLLALLAAFALAGYAAAAVVDSGQWRGFAIWFIAAVIGHDLLLFPLYSLADLSLRRLIPRLTARTRPGPGGRTDAGPGRTDAGPGRTDAGPGGRTDAGPGGRTGGAAPAGRPELVTPPVINYIRIPAAISLLLLAVWFPLIFRLSSAAYFRASGLSTAPYLGRWLAVTGVLFTASAVCDALSLRRTSARGRKARPHPGYPPPR